MTLSIPEIFASTKTLSGRLDWVRLDVEWLSLVCPLEIDGVTLAGLQLRLKALRHFPDEAVSAQLEYRAPRGKHDPICRVEWRPLKSHNNKGKGPTEYRYREIRGSHLHSFELNWIYIVSGARVVRLKVAVPINPDPQTYEDLLVYMGKEFRISDADRLPKPTWEPRLI
jgi:hypothetical protein